MKRASRIKLPVKLTMWQGGTIRRPNWCRIPRYTPPLFRRTLSRKGEQVAGVWKPLYDQFGIHIDFAHRTFRWDSEANAKAHVHMPRKPLYCSTLHGFKIRRGTTKKGRSAAPTKAFAQRFYPLERLIFSESVVRWWYPSKGKRKSPQFLTNFR